MALFPAHVDMSPLGQNLHDLHVMLSLLAVTVALVPARAAKGSGWHRIGGLVYVPIAAVALGVGLMLALIERSAVLFCFDAFCGYLLLSGGRAAHSRGKVSFLDLALPWSLGALGILAALWAMALADFFPKGFYLFFFAANALTLSWRDSRTIRQSHAWNRHTLFLGPEEPNRASSWLNRHMVGMVGSVLANLSVVILTLLPEAWHPLWPITLGLMAFFLGKRSPAKATRHTVRDGLARD